MHCRNVQHAAITSLKSRHGATADCRPQRDPLLGSCALPHITLVRPAQRGKDTSRRLSAASTPRGADFRSIGNGGVSSLVAAPPLLLLDAAVSVSLVLVDRYSTAAGGTLGGVD
jgi:hypothetical protein